MYEEMERDGGDIIDLEEELLRRQQEAAVTRADAYLTKFGHLHARINHQMQMKERFQDLATRTTGDPFAMPGAGGEDSRSLAVQRVIDLDREITSQIDHLANLRNEIWCILGQMENQDVALILDDLYLEGKTIEQTAKKNHFGKRYIYKLRRTGLLEVDRIMARQETMRGYVSPLGG